MGVGSCEFESHLGHLKGDKYYLSPFLFLLSTYSYLLSLLLFCLVENF